MSRSGVLAVAVFWGWVAAALKYGVVVLLLPVMSLLVVAISGFLYSAVAAWEEEE